MRGANWDAIGLSVHVKRSALQPEELIAKVADNVRTLKERYGKPVLIVETGYYNDREVEANQWLCDFMKQLMEAGASGLYYWEPELTDEYDLGAWNPRTRKPSLAMDAFLGVRHTEGSATGISDVARPKDKGQMKKDHWYTLDGRRLNGEPTRRGLNIVRTKSGETYKVVK